MKPAKKIFLFLILTALLLGAGLALDPLIEMYKRGEILLEEDPLFGKNVDWEELFYDVAKDMVIAPDGSIYVTNARQHNVFHFDKQGRYIKKFGQKGQGPLDFFHPGAPTILDKKYLVVMEYPLNRRISLVNLEHVDPRHTVVLKTEYPVWDATALRDNKVAYITRNYISLSKWDKKRVTHVIIKNAVTGEERVAASHELAFRCRSDKVQFLLTKKKYFGKVFIAQTKDGNLLVGCSDRAAIDIFSPDGKKLKSFNLDYQPVKLPEDRRKKIMDKFSRSIEGNSPLGKKLAADFKNALSGSKLLGDYFPYFTHLLVDSAGNILVFPNDADCGDDCPIRFRVYSPDGRFICSTKINKGKFDFQIDDNSDNILFTGNGIYGLFQLKDSGDISLRIVRIKLETIN